MLDKFRIQITRMSYSKMTISGAKQGQHQGSGNTKIQIRKKFSRQTGYF